MSSYEVPDPILNSAYEEPGRHWYILEGRMPEERPGRRPAIVYPPRDQAREWDLSGDLLRPSPDYYPGYEMVLVNLIRQHVKAWRDAKPDPWPGVSRTTLELLRYWRREGRDPRKRLFFAQLEAAETIVFLSEARQDFLQGITVPMDEPSDTRQENGIRAFRRYASKMATGAGKTTVMAMLAAWSILNKVDNRADGRFSDVVLALCPNLTIRNRLAELDPKLGEASLYRTRDLVPPHLIPRMTDGKVLVMNWQDLALREVNADGISARVRRQGVEQKSIETITIAEKSTTARGTRYLTEDELRRQVDLGLLRVVAGGEQRDKAGRLVKVRVEATRWVESDTAWVNRVIGREIGGKQNLLVFNDEAHHAYRIRRDEPEDEEDELFGEDEEAEEFFREATVWVEGLDRIHKLRGINFCVDLSATPYYLGRVGQDVNKPFPWVVSDFGLVDAIESGMVKIPQLVARDNTGRDIPCYFNLWEWLMEPGRLTAAERGAGRGSPKPEAILRYAHHPIGILGGMWDELRREWTARGETRPPVFILVCKNTRIAKVFYEWLAEDKHAADIPRCLVEGFKNRDGQINTIRVDTKVVHETDTGGAKNDEMRWMRLTLDTVGKATWPTDRQGRPIYPEDFEELARKLGKPLHPPGRDVRCIVSVGMLTEGWDCCTVTHVIGLRPFMSQLLCEQVVGRGLRRASYEADEEGKFKEETAAVFGVPFQVIPFKASPTAGTVRPVTRWHIHPVPQKAEFRISFPRVEGYTQAIRNRVTVKWDDEPVTPLVPGQIPPEVQMKATLPSNTGRPSLMGPGKLTDVSLNPYRRGVRLQMLVFDLATSLCREYLADGHSEVPAHVLFPQLVRIVDRYLHEKIEVLPPAQRVDVFLAPYYGWVVDRLRAAIHPDTAQGEIPELPRYEQNREPGSTDEVDFWTRRQPFEAVRCHLSGLLADTLRWEQSSAYFIDTHPATAAFVKNGPELGFTIPYLHNGQPHDYVPDFIVKLRTQQAERPRHLILETKGFDSLEQDKRAAARRWVRAVNADGRFGLWDYDVAHRPEEVIARINVAAGLAQEANAGG